MRIWDIHPKHLCRKHLLAEHGELHGLWNILTKNKSGGGYLRHPETQRWINKTSALFQRHEILVREFKNRGYNHTSNLDKKLARGSFFQKKYINTINEQEIILKNKPCECLLNNN